MAILAELIVKIGAEISGLQKGIAEAKERVSSLQRSMEAALPASRAVAGGLLAVGAAAVGASVKGLQLAASMEQSKIAFGTMLGSAQDADKFLRDLWDFAAKTPFEFEGLQNASRMLLAFGFQAKDIIPIMTAVGNAVSGLGGGAFEIDRVVRALGQMQAKGKVSAEEMMQLAELGIPAWDMLAKTIGVSVPEAMKMAEKGTIPAATAIKGFIEEMNKRFPDMMAKQSTSLLGMWSTAKDNVSGVLRVLGEEIIKTFDLKPKLAGAIEALSRLSSLLQAEGLRGALQKLFPPNLQATIVLIAGAIGGALVPAIWAFASGVIAATLPLLPFMAAGAALAALAFVIYRNWEPIKNFFPNLWNSIKTAVVNAANDVLNFLRNWGPLILAAVTGPVGLLVYAVATHWEQIKQATTGAWDTIKNGVVAAFQWMYNHNYYFQALVDFIRNAWNAIREFSITVWNSLKDTLAGIWEAIKGAVTERWQAIQNVTITVWSAISGWLSGLWTRIQGQVSAAWNAIYGVISGVWNRIKEGFDNLVKTAWNWGKNLMNNFIEGFKSMFSRLWDSLKEAADAVAGFLGFHSPTKLGPGRYADEWAPNLVKMYAEGIKKNLPQLQASLSEFALNLSPAALAPAIANSYSTSNAYYGGNTIYIQVSGGNNASDLADQLMRELRKRGLRL